MRNGNRKKNKSERAQERERKKNNKKLLPPFHVIPLATVLFSMN